MNIIFDSDNNDNNDMINLKLFLLSFKEAINTNDEEALNDLISDDYRSITAMNKNKTDLVKYLLTCFPRSLILKFNADVKLIQINVNKDGQKVTDYELILKPSYKYTLKYTPITIFKGSFGRSKTLFVRVVRNETGLFQLKNIEDRD
ncbi:MAG: hypothetical protein F6K26_10730 [Moorea sp. SIO2I5]|nr:hypothetical protein [Moorena sp. SIO2I5]